MNDLKIEKKHNLNRISLGSNIILNVIFCLIMLACVVPLLLVISVSFSSESSILKNGYQFWPSKFDLAAYSYIFKYGQTILQAYGVSIFVTVVGSVLSLLCITLYAYPLSRSDFKYKNQFAFFAFFTTIFGGGLVPWVMVYSSLLKIDGTIWILIIPYLLNAWWVIIMRTFMKSAVPEELIEAARIDGAGEFRIFFQVVIPLCKAGLATIMLFCLLRYWNDYYLSLIFVKNPNLYTIQYYMYEMLNNISYMLSNSNIPAEARRNLPSESARMAIAVVAVGPIIFAYPFFQRYFVKGLTIGAVKG